MNVQLTPGADAPADILRRYIDHDRDDVLGLTRNMPPETQAEYLQVHDEAIAALAALCDRPALAAASRNRLRRALDAAIRRDEQWLNEEGWTTSRVDGVGAMTQKFCDASNRFRLGSRWLIVLAATIEAELGNPAEAERPELACPARLSEYLRETGATWALPLFRNEERSVGEIWATANDPEPMLALLAALRPPHYANLLRHFMVDAVELARGLDLGEDGFSFTPALEAALGLARARARGEIALRDLPRVNPLRRTVTADDDSQAVDRALTLVCTAIAENVIWGARMLVARVADHGYMAAYANACAEQQARGGPTDFPHTPGVIAARETGEQGRATMQAKLAQLLRERFPNPFA